VHIAVIKDSGPSEARVAATPDTVKGYIKDGHIVSVTKGAGVAANFSDADYKEAGAKIATSNTTCVKTADIVCFLLNQTLQVTGLLLKPQAFMAALCR